MLLNYKSYINENYQEIDTLTSIETIQVNRDGQRNVYKINDITIYVVDVV